jgi:hypothetical protein
MIVLYWKDSPNIEDCRFNQAIRGEFTLTEQGGRLYMEGYSKPIVNDATKVGWFPAPDQEIPSPEYIEVEGEIEIAVERTIGELNLRYYDSDTLPCSAHYAQLTAVHPGDRLKAEVRRYFMGEWYDGIRCLGSKTAVERYQAGEITLADTSISDPLDPANKDSWVKVDFITENFDGEKMIPIVMDKVEL